MMMDCGCGFGQWFQFRKPMVQWKWSHFDQWLTHCHSKHHIHSSQKFVGWNLRKWKLSTKIRRSIFGPKNPLIPNEFDELPWKCEIWSFGDSFPGSKRKWIWGLLPWSRNWSTCMLYLAVPWDWRERFLTVTMVRWIDLTMRRKSQFRYFQKYILYKVVYGICLLVLLFCSGITLQGTKKSHLGKRKVTFKSALARHMWVTTWVPRRLVSSLVGLGEFGEKLSFSSF